MSKKREVMVFSPISQKWEFATQNSNAQWERRDGSFICDVGAELGWQPVPQRPEAKKE